MLLAYWLNVIWRYYCQPYDWLWRARSNMQKTQEKSSYFNLVTFDNTLMSAIVVRSSLSSLHSRLEFPKNKTYSNNILKWRVPTQSCIFMECFAPFSLQCNKFSDFTLMHWIGNARGYRKIAQIDKVGSSTRWIKCSKMRNQIVLTSLENPAWLQNIRLWVSLIFSSITYIS